NNSTLSATGNSFTNAAGGTFTNQGSAFFTIPFSNAGNIDVESGFLGTANSLALDGSAILTGQPSGTLEVDGGLTGTTTNSDRYSPQETVVLQGAHLASNAQTLEVMSQDLGAVAAGFTRNFAYGALKVSSNNYVRLMDNADNAAGTGAEALYVN